MALDLAAAARWTARFAALIEENKQYLIDLDAQIGDADHGANLDRGMKKVMELDVTGFASPGDYLKKVGMTLVSTVGGASGPLYGTFFLRLGAAWPEEGDAAGLGAALRAGLEGIQARGKAVVGDKTMVDALAPAVDAYDAAAGSGTGPALAAAAAACAAGRDATIPLVARKGRASYLGERSAGHQDPGATSVTLLLDAAAETLG
ncbi:MAG: dihydroxyacetone kinase subunit L [Propionibacteriaceae bacterium]|jgi:dihydroxyacetone kinase phosphoprotein-dependent L subunit|nr:dihydroxyacetone kinase subunit L [Propionibacteriaceae bacterium]